MVNFSVYRLIVCRMCFSQMFHSNSLFFTFSNFLIRSIGLICLQSRLITSCRIVAYIGLAVTPLKGMLPHHAGCDRRMAIYKCPPPRVPSWVGQGYAARGVCINKESPLLTFNFQFSTFNFQTSLLLWYCLIHILYCRRTCGLLCLNPCCCGIVWYTIPSSVTSIEKS